MTAEWSLDMVLRCKVFNPNVKALEIDGRTMPNSHCELIDSVHFRTPTASLLVDDCLGRRGGLSAAPAKVSDL